MTRAEQSLRALLEGARGEGLPVGLQRAAAEAFLARGLPTPREEAWRFTPLGALGEVPFVPAARALDGAAVERLARPALAGAAVRLVFVNGQLDASLSDTGGLPPGVVVGSLAAPPHEGTERALAYLGRLAQPGEQPFAALNTALLEDGALVSIPPGVKLAEPLHLVFVTHSPGRAAAVHPRLLVWLGPGSEAALVESYVGGGEHPYLCNVVAEVVLEEGARLEHTRLQEEGARAFHLHHLYVRQQRGAHLRAHAVALGAALGRSEVRAALAGERAEAALHGLYLADGRRQVDNLVLVEHLVPRGTSREHYKGILDGASRALFSGRVRVHPDAQKTDAYQSNSNLLLSDDAVVNSQPQLEILADDVKAGHGGTVGQLDAAALFYLRSRGVPLDEARGLLTWAFASELVEQVHPPAVRERVRERVLAHLPGALRRWEAT